MGLRWLIFIPIFVACSVSHQNQAPASASVLPKSWYTLPENGSGGDEAPSAETDQNIQAVFRAHMDALNEANQVSIASASGPWHLDGLIADFSVSMNGFFGVLMGGGTATVKTTWNKVKAAKAKPIPHAKSPVVKVSSSMSVQDVEKQLEPAIRSAVATGAVKDESTLRKNLRTQGAQFIALCKAMDRVKVKSSWHVESVQSQLTFNVLGQVTPAVGLGGTLNIFFDWQRVTGTAALTSSGSSNLAQFLQTVAEEIPLALRDAKSVPVKGFELSQFQLGLAIATSGQFGIGTIGGGLQTKVIFAKDPASNVAIMDKPESSAYVNIVKETASPGHLAFAEKAGVAFERVALSDSADPSSNRSGVIYHVPRDVFRAGLKKAIEMGSFFAGAAKKQDSVSFQLAICETEFDASIGGSFSLASVSMTGEVLLDFTRKGG